MISSLALIMLAMAFGQISAWHETGHMLTAEIARLTLLDIDSNALTQAERFISYHKDDCGETSKVFIEASTWPDKIKEDNNKMMNDWHFVDQYWSLDGTSIDDVVTRGEILYHPSNVTKQIDYAVTSLMSDPSYSSHSKFWGHQDPNFMKSIVTRQLIHWIGDVHQPLHASSAVSAKHWYGDAGGNAFSIKWPTEDNLLGKEQDFGSSFYGKELHFFWDHLFYKFSPEGNDEGELTSPVTEDNKEWATTYAKQIMDLHPKSDYEYDDYKWSEDASLAWAKESLEIAKSFVYEGLEEDSTFPQSYIEQARAKCMERLAIGGYRLAYAIKEAMRYEPRDSSALMKTEEINAENDPSAYIRKARRMLEHRAK